MVIEDGGDATATDHVYFKTSNISVSAGPVQGRFHIQDSLVILKMSFLRTRQELKTDTQLTKQLEVLKLVSSLTKESIQHQENFEMTMGLLTFFLTTTTGDVPFCST